MKAHRRQNHHCFKRPLSSAHCLNFCRWVLLGSGEFITGLYIWQPLLQLVSRRTLFLAGKACDDDDDDDSTNSLKLLHSRAQEDGIYVRALRDFDPYAVRTGQLITGQNWQSSKATADLVVDALSFGVRNMP